MEYIKLNPHKRPFPGAPAPRLASENEGVESERTISDTAHKEPNKQKRAQSERVSSTAHSSSLDAQVSEIVGTSTQFNGNSVQVGVPHGDRHEGLMDIMRNALNSNVGIVEPGRQKKGNMDGALDDSPASSNKSVVSSRSSLNEPSHGLPDGAHDHDEQLGSLVDAQHGGIITQDLQLGGTQLEAAHKTVLKHPHIVVDGKGNFVGFSERRVHNMHVRIVTPK